VTLAYLRSAYGWRTWRRLAYLAAGCALGLLGSVYIVAVFYAGAALLLLVLGFGVLAVGLRGGQILATGHRILARRLLDVEVDDPAPRRPTEPGLLGWVRAALTDIAGWRSALYLLLSGPLALTVLYVAVIYWGFAVGMASYPLWWWLAPAETGVAINEVTFDTWPRALVLAAVGLLLLLAAPKVTDGLVAPGRLLVKMLLRPTRSARLQETRTLAVETSAAALRRIERDLHDGAQAQLVALAMKLGLAKEELSSGDTAAALVLVDTAHQDAKQAIVELRDLARGIHPPALDGGLGPALETLAARSAVPVELHVDLTARPSAAIETIAYFSAAELLANVAKHSRAGRAVLSLAPGRPGWLRMTIVDDGVGGAAPAGGLAGLADRVRTVEGRLEIVSPPGGPTVVTVDLPVHA